MLHIVFGLMIQKLWGFKDFSCSSGMLSTTANGAKFAQICPKLPKFAQICPKTISLRNLEIPPKIEILVFSKN
jgi:hypothetical protein